MKWCRHFLPCFVFYFGQGRSIGYDIFHNGSGLSIYLPPVIIVDVCWQGKIGWWYKKGIFRIKIGRYEYRY